MDCMRYHPISRSLTRPSRVEVMSTVSIQSSLLRWDSTFPSVSEAGRVGRDKVVLGTLKCGTSQMTKLIYKGANEVLAFGTMVV